MWNNLRIEYRMAKLQEYVASIQTSVKALDVAFKNTTRASDVISYINNIRTNISNLQTYLENQLKLASDKYKNINLLEDYKNKITSITMAASILSNSIDVFYNSVTKNPLSNQSDQMENIKKSVEALEDSTKGFVEINIKNKPLDLQQTGLNVPAKDSFSRFQAKLARMRENNAQEILNQHQRQRQHTQGGRRSRRRTRRNCKTYRARKHYRSRHRTRRV